jgi:hypothetical protein
VSREGPSTCLILVHPSSVCAVERHLIIRRALLLDFVGTSMRPARCVSLLFSASFRECFLFFPPLPSPSLVASYTCTQHPMPLTKEGQFHGLPSSGRRLRTCVLSAMYCAGSGGQMIYLRGEIDLLLSELGRRLGRGAASVSNIMGWYFWR